MRYKQFLQVPSSFVRDFVEVLEIKKKWDLPLSRYEKMIKKHMVRLYNERR
jgi:hypothetical protein